MMMEHRVPPVEDTLRLRNNAGLTPRNRVSAEAGLPHSCAAVCVSEGGRIAGMGRAVGDGALFFHIVDIAVEPSHQGHGIGKAIMAALMRRLRTIAPARA